MNGLKTLKPAPGERGGVTRGVVLSLVLHPIALITGAFIGQAMHPPDGALLVLPFLVLIGVTQWIYLGPVAWLLRRRGSTVMAKGVMVGGGLVTLASVLVYAATVLKSQQDEAYLQRIRQAEREHPTDYVRADGVVTVVDDKHFEFRRDDDGTVVSLLTREGLDYVFLKKDGGYEMRTRDILKPGVRVAIDYSQERGKPPLSASIVRVYEEGARRN